MTQNKLIGITGGIGSGKSAVIAIISRFYPVVKMDDFTEPSYKIAEKELKAEFGDDIFSEERVDKARLRDVVFEDSAKLERLNAILHPIIIAETLKKAKTLGKIVFIECPLLFEQNLQSLFDEVWLITADKKRREERIIKRDGLNAEIAKKKIEALMPDENKKASSDVIIHNDKDLSELETEVSRELERLKKRTE